MEIDGPTSVLCIEARRLAAEYPHEVRRAALQAVYCAVPFVEELGARASVYAACGFAHDWLACLEAEICTAGQVTELYQLQQLVFDAQAERRDAAMLLAVVCALLRGDGDIVRELALAADALGYDVPLSAFCEEIAAEAMRLAR